MIISSGSVQINLSLCDNQVEKGFDAYDENGNRIQIKSRYWRKSGNSFDGLDLDGFDYLMAVLYEKALSGC